MTPEVPENYYKDLLSATVNKVQSQTKIDPYKPIEVESKLFDRYKDLTVLPSDVYGGKEVDNRFSLTQSFFDRTANDIKVFGVNAGTMFASALWSIPDILMNISVNKSFEENIKAIGDTPFQRTLFDFRKGFEEDHINYNSSVDDQTGVWNTIKNTMLPGWYTGSSHGWGELFRSVGYGVGVGASFFVPTGGVIGKGLNAISKASGMTKGIGKFPQLLNEVVYSLNNSKNLNQMGSLIDDVVNTSNNLNKTLANADVINKLGNSAKWLHKSLAGAYGEAAFEGLEGEQAVIDDLTQKFVSEKGYSPTGKDLTDIRNIAKDARSARFYINLGMLMVSNTYQMGRIFRHLDHQRETIEAIGRKGLKIDVVDGKAVAASKKTLRGDWWQQGFGKKLAPAVGAIKSVATDPKGIFLESLSEGVEEFSQTVVEKAVNNYSEFRYNNKGKYGVLDSLKFISSGIKEAMSEEGLKSFLSGVMAGGGQQLAQSAMVSVGTFKERVATKAELDKTLGQYGIFDIKDAARAMNVDSIRGTVTDRVFDTQEATNINEAFENTYDTKLYKDLEDLTFFSIAKPYLMRGHADVLKQQFQYAVENYEGDISEMFNTKSSKEEVISSFNKKIDEISNSFKLVSNSFRNPYDPNSSDEEERKSAFLFNIALVPEIAYSHYRLGRLKTRLTEINNELGPLYEEFKNTTNYKDIPNLQKQIDKRISELEDTIKSPEISQQISQYKKSKKSLEEALEEKDETEKENKYNRFLSDYAKATALYTGVEVDKLSIDNFMNKVKDVHKLKADLDFVNIGLDKYRRGDALDVAKKAYFKGEQSFREVSEDDRIRKVFGDKQKYEDFAKEAYEKYIENGVLTEGQLEAALKRASTTIEDITKELDGLSEEEGERIREIEDLILDWSGKLSHLKEGNSYEEIFEIIKKASGLEKPIITDEVRKKVEEILSKKLPVKKVEEDSKYEEFKSELSNYLEGDDIPNLVRDEISDLNEVTLNLFEIIDRVEFSKLPIQQQIDILKLVKKYFPEKKIQEQIDSEIKKLEKGEPAFENFESYTIVKDSRGYTVLTSDSSRTFNSKEDAIKYIESIKPIVSEGINNIESKFENGVWNVLPTLTPEELQEERLETDVRNKTLLDLKEEKSNEEFLSIVAANTSLEYFSYENGTIDPKYKKHLGWLSEGVLRSPVVDTIQFIYSDDNVRFKYQSFKNPIESLRFASKKDFELKINGKNKSGEFSIPSAAKRKEVLDLLEEYKATGKTYYQLLKDVVSSNSIAINLYNSLVSSGIISFKGSPQEQLDIINSKQDLFNTLKKNIGTSNFISDNYSLSQEFFFERDKEDEKTSVNITDVPHPLANIKDERGNNSNKFVFFELPDPVSSDKFNINFISPENKSAKKLIVESISNRLKANPNLKLFSGFYILTTDSRGIPFTYILKNKPVDEASLNSVFRDVSLTDTQKINTFAIISDKLGSPANRNLGVIKNDKGELAFSFEYTNPKTGKELIGAIDIPNRVFSEDGNFLDFLKEMEKKFLEGNVKWKDKNTKERIEDTISIELSILPVYKTESGRKPASIQDILDTRMVSSINPKQFFINKFVLSPKEPPVVKVKPDIVETSPPEFEEYSGSEELDVASFASLFETPELRAEETETKDFSKSIENIIDGMKDSHKIYYDRVNREYLNTFFSEVFTPEEVTPKLINFVLHAFIGERIKNKTIPIVLNENLNKNILKTMIDGNIPNDTIITSFTSPSNPVNLSKQGILQKDNNSVDYETEIQNLINNCRP